MLDHLRSGFGYGDFSLSLSYNYPLPGILRVLTARISFWLYEALSLGEIKFDDR